GVCARVALGQHVLALLASEIALVGEREEGVLDDRAAHGFSALDLASEEHALARRERALHEVLRREWPLQERRQRARGGAVALDEALHHRDVQERALAAFARRGETHVAGVVADDLSVVRHRGERLGEDRLEARVGAVLELVLEEARQREHALAEEPRIERRL